MAYIPYRSMILIPEGHALTFPDLLESIRNKFSSKNIGIEIQGKHEILIRDGSWALSVSWEDVPHVLIESREIAARFSSVEADRAAISTAVSYSAAAVIRVTAAVAGGGRLRSPRSWEGRAGRVPQQRVARCRAERRCPPADRGLP